MDRVPRRGSAPVVNPAFIDTRPQPKVSMKTMATWTRKLSAAFMIAALVAPLLAATGASARALFHCSACPPPETTQEAEPCHGTPLLTCCDDVTTAPDGRRHQPTKLRLAAAALPVSSDPVEVSSARFSPRPDDLGWRASPLRFSVVLRL